MNRTLLFFLAASAVACSSSSSSSTPVTCDDLIAEQCARYDECEPAFVPFAYGSDDACKTRGAVVCNGLTKAPGNGFTADAMSACEAKETSASCDDVRSGAWACAIKGTREDGKGCGSDTQCASGFCKHVSSTTLCGVCGEAPALGQPCDGAGRCDAGLACTAADSTGTCVATSGIGGPCDATHACAAGVCVQGACTRLGQLGDACSQDGSTALPCDSFLDIDCDPATKKCVKVAFVQLGGACNAPTATSIVKPCIGGTYCKGATPTADGVCTDDLPDGSTCSDTPGDPPCLPPAICANSKCLVFDPSVCQ